MTYQQLFDQLTPDQMKQDVVVFKNDDDGIPTIIESIDVTAFDMYWDHGQCIGSLKEVIEGGGDVDDLTLVPAGTVSLLD